MKPPRYALLLLAACALLAGCATSSSRPAPRSTPKTGPFPSRTPFTPPGPSSLGPFTPTEVDLAQRAESYRASGLAPDTAAALRMARDYYWPLALEESRAERVQTQAWLKKIAAGKK